MAAPSVDLRHCGSFEADSAPLAPLCSPPVAFAQQRKAPANLRSCGRVVGVDRTEVVTDLPPSGSALRAVANPLGVEAPPSPVAPAASSPITERQPTDTVRGASLHHDSPGSRADHVDHLAAQGLYNLASLVDSPKSVSTQSYSSSCCTSLCRWLCASRKVTRVKCIGDFEEDIEQELKDSEQLSDRPDPENCTRSAHSGNHGLSEAGRPDESLAPDDDHLPSQASTCGLAVSARSKPESSPPSQTPSTQSAAGTATSPSSANAMPDEVGQSSNESNFNSASGGVREEHAPEAFEACEAFDVRTSADTELAPEGAEPPLPTPFVVEPVEEPAAERVAVGVSELERTVDMIMWRLREVTPPAERHRVFIEQCRAWHPDKNAGDDRRATVAFQRLQSTRTWFLAKDEPSRSESMDCDDEVPF